MSQYIWNVLYHLDILINQLFPGARPYETISSRWGRTDRVWLFNWGSKLLDIVDRKGHCRDARIKYELMQAAYQKGIEQNLSARQNKTA